MIVAEALELLTGLRSKFKTTSPYVGPDLLALQLMEYNLFEFAETKTQSRLASMMKLLIDDNKQIRSFAEFKELCHKEVDKFNTRYLQAEYNLSIAVGQNSAAYLRFMAEKDTVTSFVQYKTIGDSKVRASHQALHNKIFNLSDKEAMDLFPPNGYGCRCEMVQYLGNTDGKVTKGKTAKVAIEQTDPKYKGSQFELNRGDLKQVFTKKQFYGDLKGLPEKLNDMTFDKYGLKKWEDFKQDLNAIQLDKTITEKNAKELFKPYKKTDYMGFEDYLGRKMVLKKEIFEKHTKGYYLGENELRHQIFPHLKGILENPDEVWYFDYKNNGQKFQSRYIKFYGDRAVIIDCDLDTETHGLEIKTWYNMVAPEKTIRKGLKIK
ncbi:phage minor head protein [Capnocytophaga canis]|uniref:phage minor head protein n=1 Tax=Capnocytophaga canis TaxID=1848903 RepID=UPI0037D50A87